MLHSTVTGRNIFPYDKFPERYEDAHLFEMIDRLGTLPLTFFLAWPCCKKYFHASGNLYNSMQGGKPEKGVFSERVTLEEALKRENPIQEEFGEEQGRRVLDLLGLVLKFEPLEKLGADDIMRLV